MFIISYLSLAVLSLFPLHVCFCLTVNCLLLEQSSLKPYLANKADPDSKH